VPEAYSSGVLGINHPYFLKTNTSLKEKRSLFEKPLPKNPVYAPDTCNTKFFFKYISWGIPEKPNPAIAVNSTSSS